MKSNRQSSRVALELLDSGVTEMAAALHDRFAAAQPFPHVVIDGFFEEAFARSLLEGFPAPDGSRSRNRYGAAGEKAFRRDLVALGPAYRTANALFASAEFREWLGNVAGIDDLLYDESNYGGGTHENFDGRDLRPHIDFNHHPVTGLFRRINLIAYLNEGWQPEWGGAIALHSEPRDPLDLVTSYLPVFNRCIIFETSERSWHGFERISLPEGEKHRTRKSLSIYFYTRHRPERDIHRNHTTFYIPRPLPQHYRAGRELTADDEAELGELIGQRDRLIDLYQAELGKQEADSAQAARLRILAAELRSKQPLPLLGYAQQNGPVSGWYDDGWSGAELRFSIHAVRTVTEIAATVLIPQAMPDGARLRIQAGATLVADVPAVPGTVEVRGAVKIPAGEHWEICISTTATANLSEAGVSQDIRDLGFYLQQIVTEHAATDE